MSLFLDSSVLVAALVEDEKHHEACLKLLRRRELSAWSHALAETFSTLTGGRLGLRVAPAVAAELIEVSLLPRLKLVELSGAELAAALAEAESAGVRGVALYDYLHLCAARKVRASALFTLNVRHFAVIAGRGDPRIEAPA